MVRKVPNLYVCSKCFVRAGVNIFVLCDQMHWMSSFNAHLTLNHKPTSPPVPYTKPTVFTINIFALKDPTSFELEDVLFS